MDETGWKISGVGAWLWVATCKDVTLFDVAYGRGFDQARELLDADYEGVLVRDGWAPYRPAPGPPTQHASLICSGHAMRWRPICPLGLGPRPAGSPTCSPKRSPPATSRCANGGRR